MYYVIKKAFPFLVAFFLLINATHSQSISTSVFATAGNEFISTEASLQWTLGENFIETFELTDGIKSLGFHQTFPGAEPLITEKGFTVFPNPFTNRINLWSENETDELWVRIFSITGSLVHEEQILITGTYTVSLDHLIDGIYLLKITPGANQNFVIIKLSK